MLNSLDKLKVFVVDNETFGILTETSSVSVANAITNGLVNTTTMVVFIKVDMMSNKNYILLGHPVTRKFGEGNAAKIEFVDEKGTRHGVKEFLNPPERFLKRKSLARKRQYGLENIENHCKRYLARTIDYFEDDLFYHTLSKELNLCDPENEIYSDLFKEYSMIRGLEPRNVYYELKMKMQSAEITNFKFHAMWIKFSERINELEDLKEIHELTMLKFEREMMFGERK